MSHLVKYAISHPRTIFLGWLIAMAVGALGLPHLLASLTSPAVGVSGSDSQRASELVAAGLPSFGAEQLVAVFNSPTYRTTDPAFHAAFDSGTDALARATGVTGILPFPMAGDPAPAPTLPETLEPLRPLLHDEHTAYALVGLTGDDRQRQHDAPILQQELTRAATATSAGAVDAYLIGVSSFGEAAQQAEIADLVRIELIAVPAATALLILMLWAPVAAMIPMLIAGASVLSTLGAFSLATPILSIDGMLLIGVDAVGLGLGIDYALFVMTRYRQELTAGSAAPEAIRVAMATTGRTVVYSGLLLALGCLCLFLVRWTIFAQAAIGALVVIAVTLIASITLLPAVLVASTPWLNWRPRWMIQGTPLLERTPVDGGRLTRGATHLLRRPWPYALGVTAVLLLIASPATQLRSGIDLEAEALAGTPFLAGRVIADRDVPGLSSVVTIVLRRPLDTDAPDTTALLTALRADPEIAAATALDNGEDLTVVIGVPRHPAQSPPIATMVERIRGRIVPATTPPGSEVLVGGSGALAADILTETSTALWRVIGAVLLIMFAVLVAVLRSLLLPIKALAMSLLATGVAFGLMALVFQHDTAADSHLIWPQVPLIVFVLLFGLSTDYELFLVRRIQEEYRATGLHRHAVLVGLRSTARPISLAAAILAIAFGSLLISPIRSLAALGFAVAVALIVDATLIRLVLVPALMQILGRWNWWFPTMPNVFGKRMNERLSGDRWDRIHRQRTDFGVAHEDDGADSSARARGSHRPRPDGGRLAECGEPVRIRAGLRASLSRANRGDRG
ncbi:RND superfamily putative drug exporter [Nocardia pseudobrasiliensis]|uniref:RND superfamily putative drug exporter n=1 Tax=Nocardia pseudobrasiliensis TaxID=45979 RepID=A0A370HK72_9NOCA|nr:RND superfamily putative drug exporter [Nocardia pseudobrasiliensis]